MSTYSGAVYRLSLIAMCVAAITLSSWIAIPFPISFTMQTFAIFLISGCFSPQISLSAVIIYLLLGITGLPVFSGFNAGLSAFLGASGGCLLAFPFCALIISLFRKHYSEKKILYILLMLCSLVLCYLFSCLWYLFIFAPSTGANPFTALSICVIPFIIPDILKVFLTYLIFKRLTPYIEQLPK